jgi:hypothetical protein
VLGIDWDFEYYVVINSKKETMAFEADCTSVI